MASTGSIFKITGVTPDTGSFNNDGITNATSLTFSGSNATNGQEVRIYLDGTTNFIGDAKLASQNSSAWTFSYDFSQVANGTHTIYAYDVASNSWAQFPITIDTVADAAPTVSITTDANSDGWINAAEQGAAATDSIKIAFASDAKAGDVLTLTSNTGATTTHALTATDVTNGFWTTTVAKPANGATLNVSATLTDLAGNVSAAGTAKATLDITAPAAPTVALAHDTGASSTDGITKDGTLSVTGVESGAHVQYSVDGGKTWGSSFSATEGSNDVLVRQTDAAGNTGAASELKFTLDTTISQPTATLTTDSGAPGDGLTNDGSLTLSAVDSDATRVITVDGKTVSSYDPAALMDGDHTVVVTDTDTAGNTKSASISFTLDTTISQPTVALTTDSGTAGDGLTNDGSLTLSAVDADATRVITVDGKTVSTYDASTLKDGDHTVVVTDTDAAGNTKSASLAFTLDTTISQPTVALTTDSGTPGDGLTNDGGLTLSAVDSDATRVITVDGKTVSSYDASTLADGAHTVTVTDTDAAGNTKEASLSFTLDTTISQPTATLTNDSGTAGDGLTNDGSLTLSAVDSDATRVITVDGNTVSSYDASALKDGDHTVVVTDTDAAGNTKSASLTFTLDTTISQPTVALTTDSGAPADGLTNDASLTLSAVDSDATRVITVDGETVSSYDPAALKDGEHTVEVTDTDAAGNTKSASLTFTLDTTITQPTVALTTDSGAAGDGLTNDASLTLSVVDGDATRAITVDGKAVSSYDASTLKDGNHTVVVTDTDAAGNTKSASLSFTLDTTITQPTLALVKDSGKAGDGLTNDAHLTFSALDSDASRIITVDGNAVSSYDPSALKDGAHTVAVTDTDNAGNAKSVSLTFTLDTTADAAPKLTILTDANTDGHISLTEQGSATTDSVKVAFGSDAKAGDVVNLTSSTGASTSYALTATDISNGFWTAAVAKPAAGGTLTVSATLTDAAGNVSSAGTAQAVLDAVAAAPTLAGVHLNGTSSSVTLNGAAQAGGVVTVYNAVTNQKLGTTIAGADGTWSFTTAKSSSYLSATSFFGVSLTDTGGNVVKTTAEAIVGTLGNDTIKDIAGQDDVLSGAQGTDTFVFGTKFGHDVITDFIAGNGTHEVIQFSKSTFTGFSDMMAHTQQAGTNVLISDAAGDTLTLIGINMADLKAVDFLFS